MTRRRVVVVIGALVILSGVSAGAFLLGERHALGELTVVEATPDQLAAAMQDDRFYSAYSERTLLVHGLVASLTADGSGADLLQTTGGFMAGCRFDGLPTSVHPGDMITVVTEGATAERLTSAVLLMGCRLPGG